MKKISNTIFLDTSTVLFPKRISHYKEADSPQIDNVAVNLLNKLNNIKSSNIVLIDSMQYEKEEIQKLLVSYGITVELHPKWYVQYKNKAESPFLPVARWIEENKIENYLVLLNEKHKFKLDFYQESNLNFNYMHFVNEENGLNLKNIQDIYQSTNLWI